MPSTGFTGNFDFTQAGGPFASSTPMGGQFPQSPWYGQAPQGPIWTGQGYMWPSGPGSTSGGNTFPGYGPWTPPVGAIDAFNAQFGGTSPTSGGGGINQLLANFGLSLPQAGPLAGGPSAGLPLQKFGPGTGASSGIKFPGDVGQFFGLQGTGQSGGGGVPQNPFLISGALPMGSGGYPSMGGMPRGFGPSFGGMGGFPGVMGGGEMRGLLPIPRYGY